MLSVREAGCGSAAAGVSNANTGGGAGAHRCARASRRNAGAGRSNAGPRRANAGDVHLESELRGREGRGRVSGREEEGGTLTFIYDRFALVLKKRIFPAKSQIKS